MHVKMAAVTALAMALLIAACSSRTPEQRFLQSLADGVILPGYQQLAAASETLMETAQAYCAGDTDLTALQQQWRRTMGAWQAVQAIQFGPVRDDSLGWELQFWPDRTNLVAKKNRELLQGGEALTVERLQQASVVVRGLPSLEFLLFDPQAQTYADAARRCELLKAVSAHIAGVTRGLHDDWQLRYIDVLLNPGADNPEFPDARRALAAVVDSYLSSLEVIRDRKLGPPLGLKTRKQRMNAYQLESWRSQQSLQNLQRNVAALQGLLREGGLAAYLSTLGQQPLADRIEAGLGELQQMLAAVDDSLFQSLSDKRADKVLAVHRQIGPLVSLFEQELPAALGVQLGFNERDGD